MNAEKIKAHEANNYIKYEKFKPYQILINDSKQYNDVDNIAKKCKCKRI